MRGAGTGVSVSTASWSCCHETRKKGSAPFMGSFMLNRLKIRTKLILFLVIPILTILFFSVTGIYTKVQQLQATNSSHKFTTVAFHLADLVHELQKERGLSAGFVGSGGRSFREDVLKQRGRTDEKLNLFNQHLAINASGEGYWGLNDKFTYLRQELDRLPDVRNAINTLKEGDFFDVYSNLNAHALNTIQYVQVFTNDASLARQGDAYSSLLRLQERAGQERGALNGIFASGELDAKLFQQISAYIADQNTIFNNYYTVVSNKYQDMLREKMRHPVAVEVEALRAAAIYKARRNELLNDLQMMIGYGGLIHDFKDYVIRGKDWYATHFSEISIDAKNLIQQYQNLPGMSQEGIAHLNSIETTFEQYQVMLNDVTKMKKLGRSIIEIDRLISINDKPAINAIKQLRKDVTSRDTSEWWQKATFRIELIKEVSDAIRSNIVDRTRQTIAATKASVRLFLILCISNIALSFFLGYLLMRRPVEALINISANIRNMQKHRHFDQSLAVSGHDEISDLANAFNSLINERNKLDAGRKNSENALRESEEKYRRIFETVEDGYVLTDMEETILDVNPAAARMLNYDDPIELKGRNIAIDVFADAHEGATLKAALLESGKVNVFPILFKQKDGGFIIADCNIHLVYNRENEPVAMEGTFRDMTEQRKNVEELERYRNHLEELVQERTAELKAAQNNFRFALQSAQAGTWFLDIVENENNWDDRTLEIYGIAKEDFEPTYEGWKKLIHPEDIEQAEHDFSEALNKEERFSNTHRAIKSNGDIVYVLAQAYVKRDAAARPIGALGVVFDVTEKILKERELQNAKEAAEFANKAKSLFLANMSHELRTPLNTILGFSNMLERGPDITAAQQEKLGIINRSGEHLLGMINDVLDLSKIEAGRLELEPEAFDLSRMLEDIGRMFEMRAESAGLRFDLELSPTLAQYIKADIGKLRQILINLLGNAAKFTREGGFALRVWTLPIEGDPNMATLWLEVQDSGPGIAPERLEDIFKPFVQAGQPQAGSQGTGLGLTIAKSFVELMGGEISVESRLGEGALFRVELPVALAEASEASGVEVAVPAVLGLESGQPAQRILVVEDNPENRLLLTSLLEQVGFEVQEAENGEQAVTLFEQWQPHFIWMDMRMPVMDGYEATAKIRTLPGGDEVKIVAITASVFKERKDGVMAAGADDFVRKPFKPEEIFDCMARQLGVRYLYQQENEKTEKRQAVIQITSEMLAKLPHDLITELQAAVRAHDMEQTSALLDRLAGADPELANALRQLVEEMDFRGLKNLLGLPKK